MKTPISWIFWHPHQGLWNWALIRWVRKVVPMRIPQEFLRLAIVSLDTSILFARSLATRISLLGIRSLFDKALLPGKISILYLDLGTHKKGEELLLAIEEVLSSVSKNFKACGFEASRNSYKHVSKRFEDRRDVQIVNKALVFKVPDSQKIRLYNDSRNGIGNSIYRPRSLYEEVDCIRLSDFLDKMHLDKNATILLLRMNIEGAEYDVLRDLVESGWSAHIDGYFGMWDDISKIDSLRDKEFRAFLAQNKISPFTFNGRDMAWPMRKRCIAYNIHTRIMHGLRRHLLAG